MANSLIGFSSNRSRYGGKGYIAGINPGVVTVDGLPALRPIELRLREMNRNLVAKTYSDPTDGTYRFDDLDPNLQFDLISRDEPNYVYNDVLIGGVWPWTDYELYLHGLALPSNLGTSFNRTFEITGGVLPYSIAAESTIPTGVTVTLDGRSLTISSPGDPGEELLLIIEDSSTVTKTIVLSPPPSNTDDPYWDNVVSLLHFDGVQGSMKFTDQKEHTWSSIGNPHLDEIVTKFGSSSLRLDGGTDTVWRNNTFDVAFGTGDFTMEAWIRADSIVGEDVIISARNNGAGLNNNVLAIRFGKLAWSNGAVWRETAGSITPNVWTHIAASRRQGILKLFIDGVEGLSVAESTNITGARPIYLGRFDVAGAYFEGYMDDVRITKGVARYTDAFTPIEAPFFHPPADSYWGNVETLLRFNGTDGSTTFTDLKGKTWSPGGNAHIETSHSKFGGSSAGFDGVTDYISGPTTVIPNGTNVYTIEGFVYLLTATSGSVTGRHGLWAQCFSGAGGEQGVAVFANGELSVDLRAGNSTGTRVSFLTPVGSVPVGQWVHVAEVNDATSHRIYVDGVLKGEQSGKDGSWVVTSNAFRIGDRDVPTHPSARCTLNGFIDDFRITVDAARYTTDFDPPIYEATIAVPTGVTARAFRIWIPQRAPGTNNSGYMNIQMGFASTVGGPNICSTGADALVAGATTAESSSFGADYGADDAFASPRDQMLGAWHSASQASPWWASIDFGAGNEQTVREVYFTPFNTLPNERAPYEFFIQTSPDNVNWTNVFHATGITGWALNTEKAWTIDL